MTNQVFLVGRINKLELINREDKKIVNMTISVPRAYKNVEGVYETDYITCQLYNSIADNVMDYCHDNDIVGVKGRLETDKNGVLIVAAEKVTFLASKSEHDKGV